MDKLFFVTTAKLASPILLQCFHVLFSQPTYASAIVLAHDILAVWMILARIWRLIVLVLTLRGGWGHFGRRMLFARLLLASQ